MVKFDFLDKDLGIVSPAYFVYHFSTKCSSCCILVTDQISLSGCLYFLRYMWQHVSCNCYNIMDFPINLIFLIELFCLHEQKVMTKT